MKWKWLTVDRALWAVIAFAVVWGANSLYSVRADVSGLRDDMREDHSSINTRIDSLGTSLDGRIDTVAEGLARIEGQVLLRPIPPALPEGSIKR